MSIYVLGPEPHRSLLRSRLEPASNESAAFTPEDCAALLIVGEMDCPLPFVRTMRWFSGLSAGVALRFSGSTDPEVLKDLKIITVSDSESASVLHKAKVDAPVLSCADLAYLEPVVPRTQSPKSNKPIAGVFAEGDRQPELTPDFATGCDIRYVSSADFQNIDLCITSHLRGIILSVLHEVPFVVVPPHSEIIERECRGLGYPLLSDPREAWSERVEIRELLRRAKPRMRRLAERNIELVRSLLDGKRALIERPYNGANTLLVWAAPEEFWGEAQQFIADLRPGFDCLVPSSSQASPAGVRKRMAIPPGALMHWAMFPEDLKRQIENRYDNVVVCHAFNGSNRERHLADIAAQTGRHGWEFRLWTHSCASYS